MNVYVPTPSPSTMIFLMVLGVKATQVVEAGDADIILVTNVEDYRKFYRKDRAFALMLDRVSGCEGVIKHLEQNAFFLDTNNFFVGEKSIEALLSWYAAWRKIPIEEEVTESIPDASELAVCQRIYNVLVVDDTQLHLELAKKVLLGQRVTVVQTLEAAVKAMNQERFDAVLGDMEMPPDETYRSLNLESCYGVTQKVEYGFAVMFEATKRDMPVAIVTNGNHHRGWVSAMFDSLHEATVNGQKVLFFNSIGKRWDIALKRLLES